MKRVALPTVPASFRRWTSTYEAGHVEDTVLDRVAAVDGELQVQLLLLGILGVLLDGLVDRWLLGS